MPEFPSSIGSQKLQGRGSGKRMVPIAVEAVPLAQRMIACAPPPVEKAPWRFSAFVDQNTPDAFLGS